MAEYDYAWEQQLRMSRATNLSDATVFDVLSRLPVKSILRFKSVCRKWKHLFGDSQFIDAHLKESDCCYLIQHPIYKEKNRNLRTVFSLSKDDNFKELHELHYKPEHSSVTCKSVASMNGIVCIMKTVLKVFFCGILLWNPATKETRILPKLSGTCIVNTCVGFGFDPINNDYKVVVISQPEYSSEVNVYSLKTDSWRAIEANSYKHDPKILIVYVNGRMHWFGSKFRKVMIVSFDVAEEKFIAMDMPEIRYANEYSLTLCESPACLGESLLLSTSKVGGGCTIWFMKEYGDSKSWTKLHYFALNPICGSFICPYIFLDNGKIILKGKEITFLWCKNDMAYKVLNVHFGADIFKYKESLVSIKRGGSIRKRSHEQSNSALLC